jgi:hypothetical protein
MDTATCRPLPASSLLLMPQELHAKARRLLALPIKVLPLAPEHIQTLLTLIEPFQTLAVATPLEFPHLLLHFANPGLHLSHPRQDRLLVAGKGHKVPGAPVRGEELLAGRAGFFRL